MKRIGLTQRAHTLSGIAERRDMLDQRWAGLVEQLGACPIPLPNLVGNPRLYLDAVGIDALIMTGGNDVATLPNTSDTAPERDHFEAEAFAYCREKRLPVLGVCRGAQMINLLCGGRLQQIENHVALRHGIRWSDALPASWERLSEVNSYHCWAIPRGGLAAGLEPAGWAADGSVEAFYSHDLAVTGIVWHPEREPNLSRETSLFLKQALGLDPSN